MTWHSMKNSSRNKNFYECILVNKIQWLFLPMNMARKKIALLLNTMYRTHIRNMNFPCIHPIHFHCSQTRSSLFVLNYEMWSQDKLNELFIHQLWQNIKAYISRLLRSLSQLGKSLNSLFIWIYLRLYQGPINLCY